MSFKSFKHDPSETVTDKDGQQIIEEQKLNCLNGEL